MVFGKKKIIKNEIKKREEKRTKNKHSNDLLLIASDK